MTDPHRVPHPDTEAFVSPVHPVVEIIREREKRRKAERETVGLRILELQRIVLFVFNEYADQFEHNGFEAKVAKQDRETPASITLRFSLEPAGDSSKQATIRYGCSKRGVLTILGTTSGSTAPILSREIQEQLSDEMVRQETIGFIYDVFFEEA